MQVLNAWFVAAVIGAGLTLFQEVIPRPRLASGLFMHTRRVGAIASGPIIGLGSVTPLGVRRPLRHLPGFGIYRPSPCLRCRPSDWFAHLAPAQISRWVEDRLGGVRLGSASAG